MPFRSSHLLIAVVFSCTLLWFTFRSTHKASPIPSTTSTDSEARPDRDLPVVGNILGHHIVNLTNPNIEISRIQIEVSEADISPLPLLQSFDISLPPPSHVTVNQNTYPDPNPDSDSDPRQHTNPPLPPPTLTNLTIPHHPTTPLNASSFIFGVSTTYSRLLDSLPTLSHWLSNTSAPLIAHLAPTNDESLPSQTTTLATTLNITLGTIESPHPYLPRYFDLLRILHANRLPTTKWYVFIDDDTFFPSLRTLLTSFQKYDPQNPWYIGALTEDFTQMSTWGFFAYGGGGIFLSHALVELLLPHFKSCFSQTDTGDRMLAECIYRSTTTKFTWEPNLHQLDLHGDQAGFYEALRPQPLSLHHWKSTAFRSMIDMYNLSRVAVICSETCILQKFRLNNDWLLTNGFSLVKYSDYDVRHRNRPWSEDFSVERTWDSFYEGTKNMHFEHSLGPIRNRDEGKVSFRMESTVVDESNGRERVRQLYVRRRGLGNEVQGVVEVTWIRI